MESGRLRRQFASFLALVALALQLVVSFGHVHLPAIHQAQLAVSVKTQMQPLPAPQPGEDDDDYCAICANILLATNSFVPQAPQLAVPSVSRTIERSDRAAFIFVAARRTAFQSRAPPLA